MDNWIKVEDDLPELDYHCLLFSESKQVLVYTKSKEILVASLAKISIFDMYAWYSRGEAIEGVTHWQPLPKPPEESDFNEDE